MMDWTSEPSSLPPWDPDDWLSWLGQGIQAPKRCFAQHIESLLGPIRKESWRLRQTTSTWKWLSLTKRMQPEADPLLWWHRQVNNLLDHLMGPERRLYCVGPHLDQDWWLVHALAFCFRFFAFKRQAPIISPRESQNSFICSASHPWIRPPFFTFHLSSSLVCVLGHWQSWNCWAVRTRIFVLKL